MNELIVGSGPEAPDAPPAPTYSDTNLRSRMTARMLLALCEGPVQGPVGNLLHSIYINGTPAADAFGNPNFKNLQVDWRPGSASQTYISGFSQPEISYSVGTEILQAAPVVRTVQSSNTDAVRVVIQFPDGLHYSREGSNGSIFDGTVSLQIHVRDDNVGVWFGYTTVVTRGTTYSGEYARSIYVPRPAGSTGLWSVRVQRDTPDPDPFIVNKTVWGYMNEVLHVKETYNHTALLAITVDAESVGYSIPVVSCQWNWANSIKYPANYNPTTRVYTGIWNGVFNTGWTNNPAWVLMYILLDPKSGLGDDISINDIDVGSFYTAAQYNDELVPDGNGGFEPRFTFNGRLQASDAAEKTIQLIAGSFNSVLLWENGLWRIQQDRPAEPLWQVNEGNVIDGVFNYSSSPLQERTTVTHVEFTDIAEGYYPRPVTVTEPSFQAAYGYKDSHIAALGAVTEGQATRVGKWSIYTACQAFDMVKFSTGLESTAWRVGDLIRVYDPHYSGNMTAGRIVSCTSDTVVLDRPITITASSTFIGTDKLGHQAPEKQITNPAGTYSTITLDSSFTEDLPANSIFGIITDVEPRVFRLQQMAPKQDDGTIREWTGILYDESKYNYVDTIDPITPNPYPSTYISTVSPVSNIQWHTEFVNDGENIIRKLHVSWNPSTTPGAVKYNLVWKRDGRANRVVENVLTEEFVIEDGSAGDYEITIFAVSFDGKQSLGTNSTYTLNLDPGVAVGINPPTNLQLTGVDFVDYHGTEWFGQNCHIIFTNPANNDGLEVIKDFKIEVFDNDTNYAKNTYYVPGVLPGLSKTFVYTNAMNTADSGPHRSLRFEVSIRTASNKVSGEVAAVFSNPTPPLPQNVVINPVINGATLRFDPIPAIDLAGHLVWMGTSPSFTLDETSLIYDGLANYIPIVDLQPSTDYYFKIAGYDSFGKSFTGTGLNVTSSSLATTGAAPGVENVDVLPATGNIDQIVYLTTDQHLYRWNDLTSTWDVISSDVAFNSITAAHIQTNAINTNHIVAGAVTATKLNVSQLSAIAADLGSITAGSINIGPNKFQVDTNGNVEIKNAATGGRLVIINNKIEVYDDVGTLRVRMGQLS